MELYKSIEIRLTKNPPGKSLDRDKKKKKKQFVRWFFFLFSFIYIKCVSKKSLTFRHRYDDGVSVQLFPVRTRGRYQRRLLSSRPRIVYTFIIHRKKKKNKYTIKKSVIDPSVKKYYQYYPYLRTTSVRTFSSRKIMATVISELSPEK